MIPHFETIEASLALFFFCIVFIASFGGLELVLGVYLFYTSGEEEQREGLEEGLPPMIIVGMQWENMNGNGKGFITAREGNFLFMVSVTRSFLLLIPRKNCRSLQTCLQLQALLSLSNHLCTPSIVH